MCGWVHVFNYACMHVYVTIVEFSFNLRMCIFVDMSRYIHAYVTHKHTEICAYTHIHACVYTYTHTILEQPQKTAMLKGMDAQQLRWHASL